MKYCALLLGAFLTILFYSDVASHGMVEKFKEFRAYCQAESGADDVAIDQFLDKQLTDDRNFKCFLKCVFVKIGSMSESGKLQSNTLKLPRGEHVYEMCKDKEEDDSCDSAYAYAECFQNYRKEEIKSK